MNHPSTSVSLIERARNGEDEAWDRIIWIYYPIVLNWFQKMNLPVKDQEDYIQDFFAYLFGGTDNFDGARLNRLHKFEHNGRKGAFRAWLKTAFQNRVIDLLRKENKQTKAAGGTDAYHVLESLPVIPDDESQRAWEEKELLKRAMSKVKNGTDQDIWQAFQMTQLEEIPANVTAGRLGMTVGQVYAATRKVKDKIKRETEHLF